MIRHGTFTELQVRHGMFVGGFDLVDKRCFQLW